MADDLTVMAPPRMSKGRFVRLLEDAGSPARFEAKAMYDALVGGGVDPAVALGFFKMESQFGSKGITPQFDTRGIGNVRTPADPSNGGTIIATPGGNFVKYPTWAAGAADWAARMRGPLYAGSGLMTVRDITPRYAPVGDSNDPDRYADTVVAFVQANRDIAEVAPVPTLPPMRESFVKKGSVNRPGIIIPVRYVTVHETGNGSPEANAASHEHYVHNGGGPQLTSYNFVVDDTEIIGLIPIGEESNHAGTDPGNESGISMELCVNAGSNWERTKANAAALIAHLYATIPTLLPFDQSFGPHRRWTSATACPARLSGPNWPAFVEQVRAAIAANGGSEDITLDANYQANPWLRYKRYAANFVKDYPNLPGGDHFDGKLLVCGTQVLGVRHDGTYVDLMERVIDDWTSRMIELGLLQRLGDE